MKNPNDIAELTVTAEEACRATGISQATLYAYVSRGLVRAGADPNDGRRSLYDRRDIAALLSRQRRPRARKDVATSTLDWGEPSLPSSISTIVDGKLCYRGQDAIMLSRTATFDEMANLLCGASPSEKRVEAPPSQSIDGIDRMLAAMAHQATTSDDRETQDVSDILRALVNAACGAAANVGDAVEQQLAHALAVPNEALDILRQALVLCADHELNPSTYAARIAISTGASLAAALTAALATFSGSGHGRLPIVCREWIERHQRGRKSIDRRGSGTPPGFGHRLYPDGDPRSRELLRVLPIPDRVSRLADEVLEKTDEHPNIDFALAAFELAFDLKSGSASTLFATGRACGWIAHALEQRELNQSIRPRAYIVRQS
ncbi:MAG: citrate synthase family protein [Neomegalonema sp.]|nr:citrate synthase family protein [Neomegalonema sp.]